MKYLPVILFIVATNSCQKTKVFTYEEGLKNCDRIKAEMQKANPNGMPFAEPDCLLGAQVPSFEAITLEGKKINRESLKGKPSIINFWFTTCAPCVAEIPGLNAIVDKFGTDKINYIAIGRDDKQEIKEFLTNNPWRFEHIPDGNDLMRNVFKLQWGYPTTFLLNKKAEIILTIMCGKTDSTAVEEIQRKLTPGIESALKD